MGAAESSVSDTSNKSSKGANDKPMAPLPENKLTSEFVRILNGKKPSDKTQFGTRSQGAAVETEVILNRALQEANKKRKKMQKEEKELDKKRARLEADIAAQAQAAPTALTAPTAQTTPTASTAPTAHLVEQEQKVVDAAGPAQQPRVGTEERSPTASTAQTKQQLHRPQEAHGNSPYENRLVKVPTPPYGHGQAHPSTTNIYIHHGNTKEKSERRSPESDDTDSEDEIENKKKVVSGKRDKSPSRRVTNKAGKAIDEVAQEVTWFNGTIKFLSDLYFHVVIALLFGAFFPDIERRQGWEISKGYGHRVARGGASLVGLGLVTVTHRFLDKHQIEMAVRLVLTLTFVFAVCVVAGNCGYGPFMVESGENPPPPPPPPLTPPSTYPTVGPTLAPVTSSPTNFPVMVPTRRKASEASAPTREQCQKAISHLIGNLSKQVRESSFVAELLCNYLTNTGLIKDKMLCVCGNQGFLYDEVASGLTLHFDTYIPVLWNLLSDTTIQRLLKQQNPGGYANFSNFRVRDHNVDIIHIRVDDDTKSVLKLISYINNNERDLPSVAGVSLRSNGYFSTEAFAQLALHKMFPNNTIDDQKAGRILRGKEAESGNYPPQLNSIIRHLKSDPRHDYTDGPITQEHTKLLTHGAGRTELRRR